MNFHFLKSLFSTIAIDSSPPYKANEPPPLQDLRISQTKNQCHPSEHGNPLHIKSTAMAANDLVFPALVADARAFWSGCISRWVVLSRFPPSKPRVRRVQHNNNLNNMDIFISGKLRDIKRITNRPEDLWFLGPKLLTLFLFEGDLVDDDAPTRTQKAIQRQAKEKATSAKERKEEKSRRRYSSAFSPLNNNCKEGRECKKQCRKTVGAVRTPAPVWHPSAHNTHTKVQLVSAPI